ncbi:hypothetical protein Tco_0653258 [Tanacetum coccineum]|uniref:Uncharacterized protein n=1 Tax=Tanacetum coccineum TaxID=301880 RepID=A0ABQ4WZY8_9ASTR
MARPLFNRIVNEVTNHDAYFHNNIDCIRGEGIFALIKCTSTIRQLAYDVNASFLDEYMQISERTSRTALDHFCQAVMDIYGLEYLRKPTGTRRKCTTALEGTAAHVQISTSNSRKQKVKTSDGCDVFETYSRLCARNMRLRRSYDLAHNPVVGGFRAKQTTGSKVFQKYADLCARNTQPCANRGPGTSGHSSGSSPAYDDLGYCKQHCRYNLCTFCVQNISLIVL